MALETGNLETAQPATRKDAEAQLQRR